MIYAQMMVNPNADVAGIQLLTNIVAQNIYSIHFIHAPNKTKTIITHPVYVLYVVYRRANMCSACRTRSSSVKHKPSDLYFFMHKI